MEGGQQVALHLEGVVRVRAKLRAVDVVGKVVVPAGPADDQAARKAGGGGGGGAGAHG